MVVQSDGNADQFFVLNLARKVSCQTSIKWIANSKHSTHSHGMAIFNNSMWYIFPVNWDENCRKFEKKRRIRNACLFSIEMELKLNRNFVIFLRLFPVLSQLSKKAYVGICRANAQFDWCTSWKYIWISTPFCFAEYSGKSNIKFTKSDSI